MSETVSARCMCIVVLASITGSVRGDDKLSTTIQEDVIAHDRKLSEYLQDIENVLREYREPPIPIDQRPIVMEAMRGLPERFEPDELVCRKESLKDV